MSRVRRRQTVFIGWYPFELKYLMDSLYIFYVCLPEEELRTFGWTLQMKWKNTMNSRASKSFGSWRRRRRKKVLVIGKLFYCPLFGLSLRPVLLNGDGRSVSVSCRVPLKNVLLCSCRRFSFERGINLLLSVIIYLVFFFLLLRLLFITLLLLLIDVLLALYRYT